VRDNGEDKVCVALNLSDEPAKATFEKQQC
jgi:hypothetical protein